MLIALYIAIFGLPFSSDTASPLLGDPARLESVVKREVKDPARLERLRALVADLKKANEDRQAQRKAGAREVEEALAEQATTAAQAEAAVATFAAGQRARRDRQLALRLRLAALTTPAEWTAIVSEILPTPPPAAAK